jgi:hypothetical protein
VVAVAMAQAPSGGLCRRRGAGVLAARFDGTTHTLADFTGKAGAGLVPEGLHRWLNGRVQVAP